MVDRWSERGRSGFLVWRFRLVKYERNLGPAPRRDATVSRVVHDTAKAREVKRLHEFRCQVCGQRLELASGPYVEAAHVRPLGRPHDGPDELANLLCLCPNHHVLSDDGTIAIEDDLTIIGDDAALAGVLGRLRTTPGHRINPAYLHYHREHYRRWRLPDE